MSNRHFWTETMASDNNRPSQFQRQTNCLFCRLNQSYEWPIYIFTLVQKVKIAHTKFSINYPRLCLLICLLLFTRNYVVSVWRGFLFLWVLGMRYVILLWHSLSLPYNYFSKTLQVITFQNGRHILHKRNPSKGTLISGSHTFTTI